MDQKEYSSLKYGITRSIFYHERRTQWFDSVHKTGRFVSIFCGCGAAASVIGSVPLAAVVVALAGAAFSALELAFGISEKARLHASLKSRFCLLDSKFAKLGPDMADDAFRALKAERIMIEADEPPILRCLDVCCYNQYCLAVGMEESIRKLPKWQYLLRNVWHGDPLVS